MQTKKIEAQGPPKTLADVKDDNGTSLQSYARTLMEKADEKNVAMIVLAMIPPDGLNMTTNVDAENVPEILYQLASLMKNHAPDLTQVGSKGNPMVTISDPSKMN